jgi:S1-C subfamily serine protease
MIRIGLALAAMAFLAGCTPPTPVRQVADLPIIEVKNPEAARPIQLRKMVVKLRRGAEIGDLQLGLLCGSAHKLAWRSGRMTVEDEQFTDIFRQELEAANYRVVGDSDALFEDPSDWEAEYLVGGLITSMQVNACYPTPGFVGMENDSRGDAYLGVDWQVFSRLDRKVVLEVHSQGAGQVEEARPDGDVDAIFNAFAQATRNLLADQKFYDLIAGQPAAPATLNQASTGLKIASKPLLSGSVTSRSAKLRANVATVFAGDGHGSGVVIDATHLLTNEHVVRAAKRVRVRLTTGEEVTGTVMATDARRDVALIELPPSGPVGLPIRSSEAVVGETVYAVGSPLDPGLGASMSQGIVAGLRQRDGLDFIQSDATVMPGSSGGPLLDTSGNILGLTASGMEIGGAPTGINFFIPIGAALEALGIEVGSGG